MTLDDAVSPEFHRSGFACCCCTALLEFCVCGIRLGRIVQEKVAKRFYVNGMVQGVGYRFFAVRSAERLGITGWVKNLGDGRVEAYAIGSPDALKKFRSELKRGPTGAIVDDVYEEEMAVDPEFAKHFTIEHEGW